MPISWANAANGVSYLIGDPDMAGTSSATIKAHLIDAARGIQRSAPVVTEEGTVATVADQQDYPLGSDPTQGTFTGVPTSVLEVWLERGDSDWIKLRRWSDRDRPSQIYSDLPEFFIFRQGLYVSPGTSASSPVLELWPRPDAIYDMRVWCLVSPADESTAPSGLQHPVESELSIMLMAAREIRRIQGDRDAMAFYDRCIADEATFVYRGVRGDDPLVKARR